MDAHEQQQEKPQIKTDRRKWPMVWISLCIVFLLGILAGFVIFGTSGRGGNEGTTQVPAKQVNTAGPQPADSLRVADVLQYTSPLTKSVCKVRYSAKIVEIRVELSSLYPVKSLVEFDVNNLVILEIRHVSVNDQSTNMASANFVQFNSVGDNKYIILLSNKNQLPHQIDFTLSQNDLPIYQNAVQINQE